METISKTKVGIGVILGTISLFLLGLGPFLPSYPHTFISYASFAPYSWLIVFPAFSLGSLLRSAGNEALGTDVGGAVAAMVAPILFIAACRHIQRTQNPLPRVSVLVFGLLVILSFAFGVCGWHFSGPFWMPRGPYLLIQALAPPLFVLIALTWLVTQHRLTIGRSIALHWLSLAWLTWSAFPWWGELL